MCLLDSVARALPSASAARAIPAGRLVGLGDWPAQDLCNAYLVLPLIVCLYCELGSRLGLGLRTD